MLPKGRFTPNHERHEREYALSSLVNGKTEAFNVRPPEIIAVEESSVREPARACASMSERHSFGSRRSLPFPKLFFSFLEETSTLEVLQ